ncbi:hypothetical protein BDV59DRAFT_179192 [Aspergillus ambiguus]|uniref:uncharacterized protein n=1 Tax=Aspergillus ambiguus TaxID=176160 RepID=UPI003CCD9D89
MTTSAQRGPLSVVSFDLLLGLLGGSWASWGNSDDLSTDMNVSLWPPSTYQPKCHHPSSFIHVAIGCRLLYGLGRYGMVRVRLFWFSLPFCRPMLHTL